MLLCEAAGRYSPHLGTDTLLYSQAALVSFATTGEKTVAAVVTCRSEMVSIESTSTWGFSFLMSPRSPENQRSGQFEPRGQEAIEK